MTYIVCNGCGAKTKGSAIGGNTVLDVHICPNWTKDRAHIAELEAVLGPLLDHYLNCYDDNRDQLVIDAEKLLSPNWRENL